MSYRHNGAGNQTQFPFSFPYCRAVYRSSHTDQIHHEEKASERKTSLLKDAVFPAAVPVRVLQEGASCLLHSGVFCRLEEEAYFPVYREAEYFLSSSDAGRTGDHCSESVRPEPPPPDC